MAKKKAPKLKNKDRHPFRAFVTGSRVYGTPRPDSDADVVIFIPHKQVHLIRELADGPTAEDTKYALMNAGWCLRFGRLNLICVENEEQYKIWRDGTRHLRHKAKSHPVSREFAMEFMRSLREGPSEEEEAE